MFKTQPGDSGSVQGRTSVRDRSMPVQFYEALKSLLGTVLFALLPGRRPRQPAQDAGERGLRQRPVQEEAGGGCACWRTSHRGREDEEEGGEVVEEEEERAGQAQEGYNFDSREFYFDREEEEVQRVVVSGNARFERCPSAEQEEEEGDGSVSSSEPEEDEIDDGLTKEQRRKLHEATREGFVIERRGAANRFYKKTRFEEHVEESGAIVTSWRFEPFEI